jgi:hypothetical protein
MRLRYNIIACRPMCILERERELIGSIWSGVTCLALPLAAAQSLARRAPGDSRSLWCLTVAIRNKQHKQINKQCNLEVYVDDIIVKTQQGSSVILDLEKTFTNLRHFNIRLNPEKCTFGVPRGKVLGYIITKRGIEANPDKISSIAKIG